MGDSERRQTGPAALDTWGRRAQGAFSALLRFRSLNDPVIRRRLFYIAASFFVVGIYLSVRASPGLHQQVSPTHALLLLPCVFLSFLLSAADFWCMVALCGIRTSYRDAFQTVVLGTAANMLPLPGSIMVKVARLRALGIDYHPGISATLSLALVGLGLALLYAALWLFLMAIPTAAVASLVGGLSVLGPSLWQSHLRFGKGKLLLLAVLVKLLQVILFAARFLLALWALGIASSFGQASVLSVSGVLSSVAAVVPAGLGLQELLSAGIGPLVGLEAATGFLTSSLNRLAGMVTVLSFSLYFSSSRGKGFR